MLEICMIVNKVLIFFMGASIGSFLNVVCVRSRSENNTSWISGRSHCDSCGYELQWFDLIPIISFLALRGKCRKCKTKIDPLHFCAELIIGLGFVVAIDPLNLKLSLIRGLIVLALSFNVIEDLHYSEVNSFMNIIGFLLISIANLWLGVFTLPQVLALLVTYIIVILFSGNLPFLGAGDIDISYLIWYGMAGLISTAIFNSETDSFGILGIPNTIASGLDFATKFYAGLKAIGFIWVYASVIGCLYYLPKIVMKKRDRKQPIPFVPLLFMGTLCYFVIGYSVLYIF